MSSDEGLTMSRDRDAPVWDVLRTLGMEDMPILPLGAGLASEAWRVGAATPWLALRIARKDRGGATYPVEHALASLLAAQGASVPAPVRGSWEVEGWTGRAFSLMTGLDGARATPADEAVVVPALADFLAVQQSVELDGFGPLALVDGELRGVSTDPATGVVTWADRVAWPADGPSLASHPALGDRPDLRAAMEALAPRVLEAITDRPTVLVHADLHEENLLVDGSVVHVIDLGETFLGPVAWDLAAIGYFLGWHIADQVTDTLLARPDAHAGLRREDVDLVALAVGAYRWALDRALGADEDTYDAGFLRETLERITRHGP